VREREALVDRAVRVADQGGCGTAGPCRQVAVLTDENEPRNRRGARQGERGRLLDGLGVSIREVALSAESVRRVGQASSGAGDNDSGNQPSTNVVDGLVSIARAGEIRTPCHEDRFTRCSNQEHGRGQPVQPRSPPRRSQGERMRNRPEVADPA